MGIEQNRWSPKIGVILGKLICKIDNCQIKINKPRPPKIIIIIMSQLVFEQEIKVISLSQEIIYCFFKTILNLRTVFR